MEDCLSGAEVGTACCMEEVGSQLGNRHSCI